MEENQNPVEICCKNGIFKDNILMTPSGECIPCITYGSLRTEIEGHFGYFNMRFEPKINRWIIFQYVLL